MLQDIRFALRMIATRRWFSAAVIVTLALGIGVNTTVFTLVNAVLFKPVPIPGGERLVTVTNHDATSSDHWRTVSWSDFQEFRQTNHVFDGVEAASTDEAVISEAGVPPRRYHRGQVSSGLFEMLRTPAILGRGFSAADGRAGAEPVVLIGNSLWQDRYAGSPSVVGRTVRVNGKPATIVGVMPPDMRFPNDEDFWMPIVPDANWENRANHWLQVFALRRPGISIAQANADVAVIAQRLAKSFPDTNRNLSGVVMTFHDTYNGDRIRLVFLTMLGAVGLVLFIACANVANMLLSRAIGRSREISLRAALGASRGRLMRQLLVESVLLSVLGGLLGLALSWFGIHAFDLATRNVGKPYWILFTMDYVAFGYFAAISVFSGLLFGLAPAWRASKVDLNTALKESSPTGGSGRSGSLTAVLVVVQFALTVVLLGGAGLMVRSFFAAQSLNSFVRADSIFSARIQLPEGKGETYAEPEARRQFFEKLLPRLKALPGVAEVAVTTNLPGLGAPMRDIEIEGRPVTDPKDAEHTSMVVQTPNYLGTIGLPLLSGRGFNDSDGLPGKEAAIVTREFAAKYWPNAPAVGKHFRFVNEDRKPTAWITVIGVSADLVQDATERDHHPLFFITYKQEPWGWIALLIRTAGDPGTLAGPVRTEVQKIDQDLPLFDVWTLPAALEHERWFLRVFGTLFLVFALIGLLLASVGVYAVVAQNTARRTREIGIRIALGATSAGVVRLVLARGLWQLVLGLGIGLVGALLAAQLLVQIGFLIHTSPHDPIVFVAVSALLFAIGVFACWLPARRAAQIAPLEALRAE